MNKHFFKNIVLLSGFLFLVSAFGSAQANTVPVGGGTGTITITKYTSGGDGIFNYDFSGGPSRPGPFSIQSNGGSGVNESLDLLEGTYSITEIMPPGTDWNVSYAFCHSADGTTQDHLLNSIGGVVVLAGQVTLCDFSNILNSAPTLTVVKNLSPSNDPGRFNLQINGNTAGGGANVGNGGSTGAVTLSPGITYTVGETAGTNTNINDYTRTISGDCAANGTITLQNGDNKICYINNTKISANTATVTIVKRSINGGGVFNFTSTLGQAIKPLNPNSTNLFQDQVTLNSVAPGTGYTITESQPPNGFTLTGASCVGASQNGRFNGSNTISAINLVAGNNAICTFTNTFTSTTPPPVPPPTTPPPAPPTLNITKVVVPSSDSGRFNLLINSVTYARDIGNGQSTGVQNGVVGTNTFSESAGTNTSLSDYTSVVSGTGCGGTATNGTITMAAGDVKSCTITNTKKAKLTVTKVVVNTGGGTKAVSDFALFVGGISVTSDQINSFVPGSYMITESNDSNYTASYSSSCAGGSITLAAGDVKSCTITNTYKGTPPPPPSIFPSITIIKKTNHVSGTFNFWLLSPTTGSTIASASLNPASPNNWNASTTISNIMPGTYNLQEDSNFSNGFKFISGFCTMPDGSTKNATVNGGILDITLANGDNITCTFVNNATTLKLLKVVNGGPARPGDWNLSATGSSSTNFTDSGDPAIAVVHQVAITTWTLTETQVSGPTGYTPATTPWTCDSGITPTGTGKNQVTISAGQTVTCTITNNYPPPATSLTINKTATGGDGAFIFTIPGVTGSPKTINTVNGTGTTGSMTITTPGTFSITESVPPGWTFGSASCSKSYTAIANGVTITINAGETPTCTFTNTKVNTPTPPTITSVDPCGPTTDTISVNGSGFVLGAKIYLTQNPGPLTFEIPTTFVSSSKLTGDISGRAAGTYDVSVTNPDGTSSNSQGLSIGSSCGGGIGSIRIIKNTVGGDDTFNFTMTGGNGLPSSASLTTSGAFLPGFTEAYIDAAINTPAPPLGTATCQDLVDNPPSDILQEIDAVTTANASAHLNFDCKTDSNSCPGGTSGHTGLIDSSGNIDMCFSPPIPNVSGGMYYLFRHELTHARQTAEQPGKMLGTTIASCCKNEAEAYKVQCDSEDKYGAFDSFEAVAAGLNATTCATYGQNEVSCKFLGDNVCGGSMDSETFSNIKAGDGYSITEANPPSGWMLTSASCDNGTPSNVTVVAGQTTTCTFTNTKKSENNNPPPAPSTKKPIEYPIFIIPPEPPGGN